MRFIVKVSVSVLSFMVFQTGSCMNASFARAFHVARQGVNAGETREVVIQKALTAYEESKGKQAAAVPVRPAPAPAPAPVQPAPVEVLVSQSVPSAPSVNVPVVASTSASTPIQQPVLVEPQVLREVQQSSDRNGSNRSIGSRILSAFRLRGAAENAEVEQLDSTTVEQPVDEGVRTILEEIEANEETVILPENIESDGVENTQSADERLNENDESESSSVSWLQRLFRPSRQGSVIDEESSQSETSSDDEDEGRRSVSVPESVLVDGNAISVAAGFFQTNSPEAFRADARMTFARREKGGEYTQDGRNYGHQCAINSLCLSQEEERRIPVSIREKLNNEGGIFSNADELWEQIAGIVQKRIFVYEYQEGFIVGFREYGRSYGDLKRVCGEFEYDESWRVLGSHFQQLVESVNERSR